ncbi:MAG: hypothetical protein RH942_13425 [Kiloniellaceae bacterium]
MRWTAVALSALLVLMPLPLAAQSGKGAPAGSPGEREKVLAAFTKLVGQAENRARFGLPKDAFWRRSGDLAIALFGENVETLRRQLERVSEPFSEVTGLEITVVETGAEVAPDQDATRLALGADLVIVVGSRLDLAEIATTGEFDKGMLARFELGTWPFMFAFEEDHLRRGVILLADDEPAEAREASLVLATVWAFGGVTLGPELAGLVENTGSGPELTPLGEAAFGLFFHPDLEVGMPLADAVRRAETLLPQ